MERLFVCRVHRFPMEETEFVEFVADKGLKGCIHGRPGTKRQVLVMDAETLAMLNLVAGTIKENITTTGFDLKEISPGTRLQVGESLLEASMPCEPCHRMEEIRDGLKAELRGRRGWLFRVLQGGMVRRGDRIEIVEGGTAKAAD